MIQFLFCFDFICVFFTDLKIRPFKWPNEQEDLLLREIVLVEPLRFKVGAPKRGNTQMQVANIGNVIEKPKFRVNKRAV